MGSLSKKIRSGLLELITDTGPLYASPSMGERIYLLWTFRNFRRLPRQVLNERQSRLIEKLSHAPTLRQRALSPIIGSVENVRLVSGRKNEAAAKANKLIEMPKTGAAIGLTRAAGAEGISIASTGQAYSRTVSSRSDWRTVGGSALTQAVDQKRNRKPNRLPMRWNVGPERARLGLKVGAAVVFVAALAGTLFYFRDGRPAPRDTPSQIAENPRTIPTPALPGADSQPEPPHPSTLAELALSLPQSSVATQKPSAAIPIQPARSSSAPVHTLSLLSLASPTLRENADHSALPPPAAAIASRADSEMSINATVFAQPPVATPTPAPAPRVRIAAAPENFSYPNAPNRGLTGKVSLAVVIGADGSVREVNVLSGNQVLADAAARAVRSWRYRPPQMNGQAAEGEANVTVSFAGDDAVSVHFRQ